MISNESGPILQSTLQPPKSKPLGQEETLKTGCIKIEKKSFTFSLKENPKGRFLRITEEVNGRRDNLIIPSTGFAEFARLFAEMAGTSDGIPLKPGVQQLKE